MSPHRDAPSPVGSFTQDSTVNLEGLSMASTPSNSSSTLGTDSPLSSGSYDSSMAPQSRLQSQAQARPHPSQRARPLIPGVYVPTVCFFAPDTEDLDTTTIGQHAVRLARAGITGLTTQGSNGEAVHLTHAERARVTSTTRAALDGAGFSHMPILVGCGAQSVREAVLYCAEAAAAGGDYALVLPPSYYAGLFEPGFKSVVEFFTKVADASPIPIVIYNYPGAVSGMDLNSDIIIKLAQHENIAGVKLTCGNTGKLNRIAAATRGGKGSTSSTPSFLVLAGSADFTLQSLVVGGHGILAGLANIAPKSCIEIMRLYRAGQLENAQHAQDIVSRGDWAVIQGGIVSTKSGMESWFGYGGYARSPLPRPNAQENEKWKELLREIVQFEKSL